MTSTFNINYESLPEHMREGTRLYIEHGIEPGGFLTAVICNDLFEAFGHADWINQERMKDWVMFFYNEAPAGCFGSRKKMDAWIKQVRAA